MDETTVQAKHRDQPGDLDPDRSLIEPTTARSSRTVSDGFGILFGTGTYQSLPSKTVLVLVYTTQSRLGKVGLCFTSPIVRIHVKYILFSLATSGT